MADVTKHTATLMSLHHELVAMAAKVHSIGEYGITAILHAHDSMFERFCPHKVEDRVELAETIEMDKSSGWWGSRHYLIQGSPGVVVERGYAGGLFTFVVMFDLESYIPTLPSTPDKSPQPVRSRHLYHFTEKSLRPTTKAEWVPWRSEGVPPAWVAEINDRGVAHYEDTEKRSR